MDKKTEFDFNDQSLRISNEVMDATVDLIHDSYLLRNILILNNDDKDRASICVMNAIDKFYDYISSKERCKVIVNTNLVKKYEYYIHLMNLNKATDIYLFIPDKKEITNDIAKEMNIFTHHINTSKYIKKMHKTSKGNLIAMQKSANRMFEDCIKKFKSFKGEVDFDTICKDFFEDKMKHTK